MSDLTPVGTRYPAGPPTYSFGAAQSSPAATPTDLVTLYGSATKTVKVKRVTVSGLSTTAGSMDVQLIKRTAANTAGTSAAQTPAKLDSQFATATATLKLYSANASALGAGIVIEARQLNFGVAGAAGSVVWDFPAGQELILRGTAQGLAINLNGGAVPTGGKISWSVEWTEV